VLKNNNKIIKLTQMQIIEAEELKKKNKSKGSSSGSSAKTNQKNSQNASQAISVTPPKSISPTPAQMRAHHLLDTIVINLETSLNLPDEDVVR